MIPVISFEFDQQELDKFQTEQKLAEKVEAAELQRMNERDTRAKLQELTQA